MWSKDKTWKLFAKFISLPDLETYVRRRMRKQILQCRDVARCDDNRGSAVGARRRDAQLKQFSSTREETGSFRKD